MIKNAVLYAGILVVTALLIDPPSALAQTKRNRKVTAQNLVALAGMLNDRLLYMKDVAAYKWVNGLPIEDLEREQVVLKNSLLEAQKYSLDSLSIQQFFVQQILLAKQIQQYWFSQWEKHRFEDYTYADLSTVIRPALISLGDDIMATIYNLAPWNLSEDLRKKHKRLFLKEIRVKGITSDDKRRLFDAVVSIQAPYELKF